MNYKSIKTILIIATFFSFSSCIKQIEKQYTGNVVAEIDAAVLNAAFSGVTYPIVSRYLRPGIPVVATNGTTSCNIPQADSTLRRLGSGRTISIRVNLIGAQSGSDRTVGYRILDASPITTFDFPSTVSAVTTSLSACGAATVYAAQTPSAPASTLAITNAASGVNYGALSGSVTIPANSSYGFIEVQLLDAGSNAGQGRFLGIQLDSSGTVLPSLNYRTLGMVIDQR